MQKAFLPVISQAMALLPFLFLSGCAIKPIGYLTVSPYAKPLESKIRRSISIVLLNDVQDNLTVSGQGIKPMVVTDFRKTVQNGLKVVFEKNFTGVKFQEQKSDTGLVVVVYRVKPFWKLQGASTRTTGYSGNMHAITTHFIASDFQYESSLYYNNQKISAADGEVTSEGSASSISQAPAIFEEGLTAMCESINRTLLTDDNVAKIRK